MRGETSRGENLSLSKLYGYGGTYIHIPLVLHQSPYVIVQNPLRGLKKKQSIEDVPIVRKALPLDPP